MEKLTGNYQAVLTAGRMDAGTVSLMAALKEQERAENSDLMSAD